MVISVDPNGPPKPSFPLNSAFLGPKLFSCEGPEERSYSGHDPQKRGIPGLGRNASDHRPLSVDLRLRRRQCVAGPDSRGKAPGVVYLRLRVLLRGLVLFRVPPGAVLMCAIGCINWEL